jgi:hypothetical protein
MDSVNCFVERARERVKSLDYVALCCQLCSTSPHVVDTIVASLSSGTLQRPFWDAAAALSRRGGDGALPTAFAQHVWTDTDRAADGLVIDRDWRAWLVAREYVVEAIDELERHIAPTPAWQEPSAILVRSSSAPPLSPAPPDEPSTPASSTPSVHDIAGALGDNAPLVIEALAEADAFNHRNRLVGAVLCRKAGVTRKQLEKVMAFDKRLPCRCIESTANRTGGYWLTPFGKEVSTALQQTTPGEVTG